MISFNSVKRSAGIEYYIRPDGEIEINICVIKKEKQKLLIERSKNNIDLDKIPAFLNDNIPIFLIITGKGILHKQISSTDKEDQKIIFKKAIPNAHPADFYIQTYKTSEELNNFYVSLARREFTDQILQHFWQRKCNIVKCSYGPFVSSIVLPVIFPNKNKVEINFSNYLIVWDGDKIISSEPTEGNNIQEPIYFDNEAIPSNIFLAFSAALALYSRDKTIPLIHSQSLTDASEDFYQKLKFDFRGKLVLGFFLMTFLLNFLLFDYFNNKRAEFELRYLSNLENLNELKQVSAELSKKTIFLKTAGLLTPSKISYYADRLAADMPQVIQLTSEQIYPVTINQNDLTNEYLFKQGQVIIKGQASNSALVNEWIKIIRKKEFVKQVTLIRYIQDTKEEKGVFEIEILIS